MDVFVLVLDIMNIEMDSYRSSETQHKMPLKTDLGNNMHNILSIMYDSLAIIMFKVVD